MKVFLIGNYNTGKSQFKNLFKVSEIKYLDPYVNDLSTIDGLNIIVLERFYRVYNFKIPKILDKIISNHFTIYLRRKSIILSILGLLYYFLTVEKRIIDDIYDFIYYRMKISIISKQLFEKFFLNKNNIYPINICLSNKKFNLNDYLCSRYFDKYKVFLKDIELSLQLVDESIDSFCLKFNDRLGIMLDKNKLLKIEKDICNKYLFN